MSSRGAPSPGKVRNLGSPRACGVAELRTWKRDHEKL